MASCVESVTGHWATKITADPELTTLVEFGNKAKTSRELGAVLGVLASDAIIRLHPYGRHEEQRVVEEVIDKAVAYTISKNGLVSYSALLPVPAPTAD